MLRPQSTMQFSTTDELVPYEQWLRYASRLTINALPGLAWIAADDGRFDYLNQAWLDYTGLPYREVTGWGWLQAVHPDDEQALTLHWRNALVSDDTIEHELRLRRHDGSYRWFIFSAKASKDPQSNITSWYGLKTDIDHRKRLDAFFAGEIHILNLLTSGEPLSQVLEALCHIVEGASTQMLCSIVLVSDQGTHLEHGAAPSLPPAFNQAIVGRPVGDDSGPCAMAAWSKSQVVVADIANDQRWEAWNWCPLALSHGLGACWSTPIMSSSGQVLGTFAIYSLLPCMPSPEDQALIAQYTLLASISIERSRVEQARRCSEQFARGQVAALTSTLNALAKESALDKLMEHVLRTITKELSAFSSNVWLRQHPSSAIEFEFAFVDNTLLSRNSPGEAFALSISTADEIWPWSSVFATGQAIAFDLDQEKGFLWGEQLSEAGVTTILFVPMIMADHVEGVIGICFTDRRMFRSEEIELAQALSSQAMLAMQLTRLSAKSRDSAIVKERNRMARDIHDTLAQGLTGVIVQMEAAADAISRGLLTEADTHLECAGNLARNGLKEARRSVHALRPRELQNRPVHEALHEMMKKMSGGTSVEVQFDLSGDVLDLPFDWETNILHIGQEAFTNVIRHSGASHFVAKLQFNFNDVQLQFSDNGNGFNPDSRHEGFGLLGIKERVAHMNGQVTLNTEIGQGMIMTIVLPLPTVSVPKGLSF